ncbi:MAG TPA: cation-translocating P-type ATPase [Polyangiaceae bacterium]
MQQLLPIHSGLTTTEARDALTRFGPNALREQPPRSLLSRVLSQLKSALLYLLLLALALDLAAWIYAGAEGIPLEALAILGVIVLNAALGVLQEYRSERALAELKRLGAPRVWVKRDGALQRIDASQIVPGDLVRLEAGDRVPADGVAVEPESLRVDESVLTGESLPIEKSAGEHIHSGTLIAHGSALLEVERTGESSAMGKIAVSLQAIDVSRTPLEQRVDRLGTKLAKVIGVLCVALVVGAFAVEGFDRPLPILLFAVAFGVAVIPEGMPTMMTLALALGVQRMARRKAVVRRLAAVEALGSVTVIATDKTGTLTRNQLQVSELEPASADEGDMLCAMCLANDADGAGGAGDPLDVALLEHARRQGTDVAALRLAYPRLSSHGFDSGWRCMRATVLGRDGQERSFLKGAPEAILARCQLSENERALWLERASQAASSGFKVLAFARGDGAVERHLTFLGLARLWDEPRPEARGAVLAAQAAGIRVLMITGDHPATACAVARAVGIEATRAVRGDELAQSDARVDELLASSQVFARMQPEHKLRLIERLQAQGEIVAMTGDGLNDAPALKRADIGIAMGGRGSDVAREVADLVLLDDHFATIVAAIEEGRSIYANVQSFVRFSFSSNVALAILIVGAALGSVVLGLRDQDGALLIPLTALQVLWINFLGDGPPALALALDRNSTSLQERPRSPKASLLDAAGTRFVVVDGLVKGALGLSLLLLLPSLGATNLATASAVFIYEGVAKVLSMLPARRLGARPNTNPWVLAAVAASIVLQAACALFEPLRRTLGLGRLSWLELGAVLGALCVTLLAGELVVRVLRTPAVAGETTAQGLRA